MRSPDRRLFRNALFCLIFCLLLSFLLLAYPLYVIRPFRYQGPRELSVALALIRFSPALEAVLVVAALASLIWAWRASGGVSRKILASACFLFVAGCSLLSRVNVYERMFHPLDRPGFSPADKSNLDSGEEVIGIVVNGTARAYPVRIISYHHIVNDVVGGLPVVATY
jgi:hypothetical protein